MPKTDDQSLLKSLREGRSEACGELIRSHCQAVFRFLVHLTRDTHRAEDLSQETFSAAWERIASFQGRSSLATWLHRIAYTKFLDFQRSQQRAANLHQCLTSFEISPVDPFQSVTAEDESRHLHKGLSELDTTNRTLLVLHYLQGLSYREIALVMGEPEWHDQVADERSFETIATFAWRGGFQSCNPKVNLTNMDFSEPLESRLHACLRFLCQAIWRHGFWQRSPAEDQQHSDSRACLPSGGKHCGIWCGASLFRPLAC